MNIGIYNLMGRKSIDRRSLGNAVEDLAARGVQINRNRYINIIV